MPVEDTSLGVLVGYARVSTEDQSLEMQIEALKKAGVKDDNLHIEKKSGASKNRPELEYALKDCRAGDTLVVWKLDRLSRDPRQIYELLDYLNKKGVGIMSITEGFDAKTATGQLMIGVSAAFAAFERHMTMERTKAGIAAIREKRAKGARWGRQPKLTPALIKQAGEMLNRAALSGPEVARRLSVSTPTVYQYWQRNPNPKGQRFIRRPKTK